MNSVAVSTSSPRGIRQNNAVAALQALFAHRRLSRAELARHLGLNRSSSGHIVSELFANGLVREVEEEDLAEKGRARAGRPGILLELEPEAAVFLGIEIGVEHITILRIDMNATILDCQVEPFDGRALSARDAVVMATRRALADLPEGFAGKLGGFGLSAPAQLQLDGSVRKAPLLGWENVDPVTFAQEVIGDDIPCMLENEANAFAFGESYCSREDRAGVTLSLVIESGVGGGIVIDGRLYRGGHGLAGEIGHLPMRDGMELEQLIGLDHLLQRHRATSGNPDPALKDFLEKVRDGDTEAVGIARLWAMDLAAAIMAAGRLIDPDRIVLGGSLAALFPLVADEVRDHIGTNQAPGFPVPEISVHEAAEAGSAYGAACMLHQRFMSLENRALMERLEEKAART